MGIEVKRRDVIRKDVILGRMCRVKKERSSVRSFRRVEGSRDWAKIFRGEGEKDWEGAISEFRRRVLRRRRAC